MSIEERVGGLVTLPAFEKDALHIQALALRFQPSKHIPADSSPAVFNGDDQIMENRIGAPFMSYELH